jgi:hypothetical protein
MAGEFDDLTLPEDFSDLTLPDNSEGLLPEEPGRPKAEQLMDLPIAVPKGAAQTALALPEKTIKGIQGLLNTAGVPEELHEKILGPTRDWFKARQNQTQRIAETAGMKPDSGTTALGEALGGAVVPLPLPGKAKGVGTGMDKLRALVNPEGRVAQTVAAVPKGIIAGATAPGEDEGRSAVAGGVAGGAMAGIAGAGGWAGSKIINAKADRFAADVETAALDIFRKHNIPFLVGDVRQKTMLRGIEDLTVSDEQVRGSAEAARNAVNNLAGELKQDMLATKFKGLHAVRQAAKDPNHPRNAEASVVLGQVKDASGADPDWNDVIEADGGLKILQSKLLSDRYYTKLDQAAAKVSDVKQDTFKTKLDELLTKRQQTTQLPASEDKLTDLLLSYRSKAESPMAPITFAEMRQRRAAIADEMAKVGSGSAFSLRAATELREAMSKDMQLAAKAAGKPKLGDALRKADEAYAKTIDEKTTKLATILNKDSVPADRIINAFVKSGQGTAGTAKLLYDSLNDRGRKAAQFGMVSRAMKESTNVRGVFEPEKFAVEMRKLEESYGVLLSGNAKFQAQGLANALAFLNRAGEPSTINAERSARAGLGAGAIAATGGGLSAGVRAIAGITGGGFLVQKFINGGPKMQQFWLAASDLPPNSKAMANLMKTMAVQGAARMPAQSGTRQDRMQELTPEEPESGE